MEIALRMIKSVARAAATSAVLSAALLVGPLQVTASAAKVTPKPVPVATADTVVTNPPEEHHDYGWLGLIGLLGLAGLRKRPDVVDDRHITTYAPTETTRRTP